ncbi:MAG: bifunctional phosphoribosylaminoimidazolecarboxamide formyltransferase/IMP cyclohydrolase [Candidatus Bilamarchaeaceae archaeon]
MKIRRALISVYDKEGILDFASFLHKNGVEIVSSGGTASLLSKNKIPVTKVEDVTGFPEMMDGRVKTLHPKIHGGILADRRKGTHLEQAKSQGIPLIDLVVVNLYPFEDVIRKPDASEEEIIEMIDVGGPAMVRAAAKNHESVAVVVEKGDYPKIMEEMKSGGKISAETRRRLAIKAFAATSHYDVVVEAHLRKMYREQEEFPETLNLSFRKIQDLRYGENPHQKAAFYKDARVKEYSVATAQQHQGKLLSYNNILDMNSAFELVKEFDPPTAVVVKHNNPCGVASDPDLLKAYKTAKSVDPEAAFGSIVAVNRPVDERLAEEVISTYVEVIIAPKYSPKALDVFSKKGNVRVMEIEDADKRRKAYREYRSVVGGLLIQDANVKIHDELKTVTKRSPTKEEMDSLLYAWTIAKYVKSNAIVYARGSRAVAIGAGQMKRIDAAKLASMIAQSFGEETKGAVMASDAFFPFRDGIDYAAKIGITAVIQPGGSVNDKQVIGAADEHGMAMLFTGMRHFRH